MARKSKSTKVATPYGEGTVFYSNSTQRWMGQVVVGRDMNGKPKRKTVYGKDAAEVKEKLQQIKVDMYTGDFVDYSNITFAQLEKRFLDNQLSLNKFKEQTYYRHLETLKMIGEFGDHELQKINEVMCMTFLSTLVDRYSNSTIKKIYRMMNQCFKEAVKKKVIKENPMVDLERPKSKKPDRKVRALTVEEEKKLIEAIEIEKPYYGPQMLLSMYMGIRMGEVNALTIRDFNRKTNTISIDKTISKGKTRVFVNPIPKSVNGIRDLPINTAAKPVVDEILSNVKLRKDGRVFVTKRNTLVSTTTVNDSFKALLEKYDIVDKSVRGDITLHSLRHTYATRCIESGMPPKVLQKLMGHHDISITLDVYSDVFDRFSDETIRQADEYMAKIGLVG